jgi:NAD(P)-dependent dehydrogenase (short-subunit alcohol dehydrogenase family)
MKAPTTNESEDGMAIEIAGARIVITGTGSGIGRATALRCARAGAEVVAVDIDADSAEATVAAASGEGGRAHAYTCDVADADAMLALAARIEEERGAVDALVNNAGVGIAAPFLDTTLDDWQWLRSINVDGVVHGCQAFGPAMVARGRGQVVNVASGAAYFPNREMAAYCASKGAVFSLSQCLRADWRRHGVGVSVVCPGVIATPIASRTRYRGPTAARKKRAERALAMGHSPDLVAKAIVACIERNRDVVPVGLESKFAYTVIRRAPQPLRGLIARVGLP